MLSNRSTVSTIKKKLLTKIARHRLNLEATLISGQSFCWTQNSKGFWTGWIAGKPCLAEKTDEGYQFYGHDLQAEEIEDYFQLTFDLSLAIQSFPKDEWLAQALKYSPGLRILRQDPWETLASFICSSVKQISQIQAINQNLRTAFGPQITPGYFGFPDYRRVAAAGEASLRKCKLGFRARHLHRTACLLSEQSADLHAWKSLPTHELKDKLLGLPGVGEKIAGCVMLFAYGRYEVFPIDVWVERVLKRLYFARARNKSAERLKQFALDYFGPFRGYAQQYLFHWIRTSGEHRVPNGRVTSARTAR